MVASLLFGFSQNLSQAIVARSIAGGCSGTVGVIRTTVAEMVPQRELQPRAFSVMPLVWSIGSIVGPSMLPIRSLLLHSGAHSIVQVY